MQPVLDLACFHQFCHGFRDGLVLAWRKAAHSHGAQNVAGGVLQKVAARKRRERIVAKKTGLDLFLVERARNASVDIPIRTAVYAFRREISMPRTGALFMRAKATWNPYLSHTETLIGRPNSLAAFSTA
jgi:hypothetical protein